MQGDDEEGTDRWFGMFRLVGVEPLGEARAAALRGARTRILREMALFVVLLGVFCSAVIWWQPFRNFGGMAALGLTPLWHMIVQLRRLSAVRPDDRVEFFEGKAPIVQAYRDRFTDQLVSGKLVKAGRGHRLTVHSAKGLLLEVDGSPVAPVVGEVVVTARVSGPVAGAPLAIGDRRPLTAIEAEELEAITMRSALQGWVIALLSGLLALVLTFCVTMGSGSWRFGGSPLWASLTVFLITTAVVRFLQKKSAEALRARVASDRAGGLVRGTGTWRLPVLDIIWERDGLPGFKRLETGGLARARRSSARPKTF